MSMTRAEALAQLTAPDAPYALTQGLINGRDCRYFANAPLTLGQLYSENISDLTFLVFEEERLSFSEVHKRAMRLANALRTRCGITHGDRVAISMRNYPEWIISFMAVTSMGAVAVAMNALWQTDEIEYGLKHSGSKVFIADGERLQRVAPIRDQLDLQLIGTRNDPSQSDQSDFDFASLISASESTDLGWANVGPDDYATIFYTSGQPVIPKVQYPATAIFSALCFLGSLTLQPGTSNSESAHRHQPSNLQPSLRYPYFTLQDPMQSTSSLIEHSVRSWRCIAGTLRPLSRSSKLSVSLHSSHRRP